SLRRLDVSRGFDQRHGGLDHLGRSDLRAGLPHCAYGLYRQPVRNHRVMLDLVDFGALEMKARRGLETHNLSIDVGLKAAIAHFDEGGELVDGEEVAGAVAELPGHIAGIVPERLGNFTR